MIHINLFVVFMVFGSGFSFVPNYYGQTVCGSCWRRLIPHPEACQRFYNCSDTAPLPERSLLGMYENECNYPDLFDVDELKCRPFKEAKCGPGRIAAKDPCEYVKNVCRGSHCQPCNSRLPSCVGLGDGMNVHALRQWTPIYIRCDTERLNGTFFCDRHQPTRTTALFSPIKMKCVSLWEVPTSNRGLAPSCKGQINGYYVTKQRPDVYYTCPSAEVYYCSPPKVFNRTINRCA